MITWVLTISNKYYQILVEMVSVSQHFTFKCFKYKSNLEKIINTRVCDKRKATNMQHAKRYPQKETSKYPPHIFKTHESVLLQMPMTYS